jgi:hypothetical protein
MSIYAPSNDGNSPDNYATFLSKKLGISKDIQIQKEYLYKWKIKEKYR